MIWKTTPCFQFLISFFSVALVSLVLVFGLLPVSAWAAPDYASAESLETESSSAPATEPATTPREGSVYCAVLYDSDADGAGDALVFQASAAQVNTYGTRVAFWHFESNDVWQNESSVPWCDSAELVKAATFDCVVEPVSTAYWFYDMHNLESIDLAHLDTTNVTNMRCMFWNCSGLTSLDVSGFDTSNVTNMLELFKNCSNLKTIYASNTFVTDAVTDSRRMFEGCVSLVGGNGTVYDGFHDNVLYARIDREGTPGYFTLKEGDASCNEYGPANLYLIKYRPYTPIETGCATYCGYDMFWSGAQDCWLYLVAGEAESLDGAFGTNTGAALQTISLPNYETEDKLAGDINGSGILNIVDAQVAYDMACNVYSDFSTLSRERWLMADVNIDDILDATDAYAIQHAVFHGWA